MSKGTHQERQPFDVAWRTIDGLKVRYATGGKGGEKVVFFSPWPESIFAFAPVWEGLTKRFEVLALDLPGFGRSEARDDLFAPQKMGEFIAPGTAYPRMDPTKPPMTSAAFKGEGGASISDFRTPSVTSGYVVGRNDPYGLVRDAELLREQLPHARLDVLEAGHCFWEERAPEFETIVAQWVSGGFDRSGAK
jgi:pimeloyl-ACP methyl ester carboxylesterase